MNRSEQVDQHAQATLVCTHVYMYVFALYVHILTSFAYPVAWHFCLYAFGMPQTLCHYTDTNYCVWFNH